MVFGSTGSPVRRNRTGPLRFSVGGRALVFHEPARLQGLDGVVLTDEAGTTVRELTDGQEVEMLGWRLAWWEGGPRMRYNIRCPTDDRAGWVWADFLRTIPKPASTSGPPRGPRRAGTDRGSMGWRAPTGPDPATRSAAVEPQRDDAPVACPVCSTTVHPYNLWRNTKGKAVGCYMCKGRKP